MDPTIARWTGWATVALIVMAALVPITTRFYAGKRGAPGSPPVRAHVLIGLTTAAFTFLHTIVILPALGSPGATGGGMLAIAPACAAFLLLVVHAGLGLQLRDPRLRTRTQKRRAHVALAITIATLVGVHAAVLLRSA